MCIIYIYIYIYIHIYNLYIVSFAFIQYEINCCEKPLSVSPVKTISHSTYVLTTYVLYTVRRTLYDVHIYSVRRTVYDVQCTSYTVYKYIIIRTPYFHTPKWCLSLYHNVLVSNSP